MSARLVILLVIALLGSANASKITSRSRTLFASHLEKFNLQYEESEYESRKDIFLANLKKIEAHNAKKSKTFSMGVNKFTHLTKEEFADQLGYGKSSPKKSAPSWITQIDHDTSSINGRKLEMLPENHDWKTLGAVTPVKDQGACGSSWSFAATGALEGAYFVKHGKLPFDDQVSPETGFFGLSEQQLIACEQINSGCFVGGLPQYGFMFSADAGGLVSEVDNPYTSGVTPNDAGICSYTEADHETQTMPEKPFVNVVPTASAMMQAVYEQPVAISINAMNDAFQNYNFGTISDATICPAGDAQHNALLVGWGVDENFIPYWIIKNSWGPDWGDGGYVYIVRNDENVCGVLTSGTYPILVPEEGTPTTKPSASPTLKGPVVTKTLPVPGFTAQTCTPIVGGTGDASTVAFTSAMLHYKENVASQSEEQIATAFKISGYPCTPSQCLWAFAAVDAEVSFSTVVFPMYVIVKPDKSLCAYLQEGFLIQESIPVSSTILMYYMNGWYLNKEYWKITYSPTIAGAGYSLDTIYYTIQLPSPTAAPVYMPTSKPTVAPDAVASPRWWVMTAYTDTKCTPSESNYQYASAFGVCTMDTINAHDFLYWYVDEIKPLTTSKPFTLSYQRTYFDNADCTEKSLEGPDGSKTQPVQRETYNNCTVAYGTGPYKSFRYTFNQATEPPAATFSGYTDTTYTTSSLNCGVQDVTSFSVYKSNAYCYTYANQSVTYSCDGSVPQINYFRTKDCTGQKNTQAYSPSCFRSVDYDTQTTVSCGTGPVAPVAPEPAITAYLQTVEYEDAFCQTPTVTTFVSHGLCLVGTGGVFFIESIKSSSNARVTVTHTEYTDSSCKVPKGTSVVSTTLTRSCIMTGPSASQQTFYVAGNPIPAAPIYAGGVLSTFVDGSNCAASSTLSQVNVALGICISVNGTRSFVLACGADGTTTLTNYDSSATCTGATSVATYTPQDCKAAPDDLKKDYPFPTLTTGSCTAFPTPSIKKYLQQATYYMDDTCTKTTEGGPNGGVLYTSLGLCGKNNANETFYTMTIPGDIGATGIVPMTTMRFTDPACTPASLVGIPFRRSMKLNSCIQSSQDMYTKMTLIDSPAFPPASPYGNGMYTELQTQVVSSAAQCSTDKTLSYNVYPVDVCVTTGAYSSVIISCQMINGKSSSVMTDYSSPTCSTGKAFKTTTTDSTMGTCQQIFDGDFTLLKSDSISTCTAPTKVGTPTVAPSHAPATNKTDLTLPDTINGWVTTTHYDSETCSFAVDFQEQSYGLCVMEVGGADNGATIYYQVTVSPFIYINKVDSTRRYYYQYRTFYTDDKCTKLDALTPKETTTTEYYKCTKDESGMWTKNTIIRNGALKPVPPTEVDKTESFTYMIHNENTCNDMSTLSKVVLPEQTCQSVLSENNTYSFQKVDCTGNAVNQTVTFGLYRDDLCKDLIRNEVYPLDKCVEYGVGTYAHWMCPYKVAPTPAPIPAAAPTHVNGEIQGWISSFKFATEEICQAATRANTGDAIVSRTMSYGLCTVSNYSIPSKNEYIYEETSVNELLMGEADPASSHDVGSAKVQMLTTYYTDDLCSVPTNRYKEAGKIMTLANCAQDSKTGFFLKEYFTSGILEPLEYPGMTAGFQITKSLYEGCPVEREWDSTTMKASLAGQEKVCIPLTKSTSVNYECNLDDFMQASTYQYIYPNINCEGDSFNTSKIDAIECQYREMKSGQGYWLTSHCQQDNLNHRVQPQSMDNTAWITITTYSDDNCLYPVREQSDPYGICTLSPETGNAGEAVYYMDSLGVPADDLASIPITTYYYADANCYDPLAEPPRSSDIKMYPKCALVDGFYITSDSTRGPDFPVSYIEGGFQFRTFETTFYGQCSAAVSTSQNTYLGDGSCIKISETTSEKYDCNPLDSDHNTGLKYEKSVFNNSNCSGNAEVVTGLTYSDCQTAKDADGKDFSYTAVCDIKFPTPTLAPLPSAEILNWITTTYYSDEQCTVPIQEVMGSLGTCYAVSDKLWVITKLDLDTMAFNNVAYTHFYFSDDTCTTAAEDMTDELGQFSLYDCAHNPDTGNYETVSLWNKPIEPTAPFTSGFVYTSYTADSCFPEEKQYAHFSPLKTCIKSLGSDQELMYYKFTCTKDSAGTWSANQYFYSTDDCSGTSIKSSTVEKICAESHDSETLTTSWVTAECLNSFSSPTPAPEKSLNTNIQGWITQVFFDDATCDAPASYMQSYSVGLCEKDYYDEELQSWVYATTQLTSDTTDLIVTTKYYFMTSDCTGTPFNEAPTVDKITGVGLCQKVQYGTEPVTSMRTRIFFGEDGVLPPGPFTGGYFYTAYQSDSCKGMDATYILSAPEMTCNKFYNGTHYVSSNYICDDATGSVHIDRYDSDDCGASKSDTASSVEIQKISQCSENEDGTYFSVQCMAQFPTPTAAPVPESKIEEWIEVDHYDLDKTCSAAGVIDTSSQSYGLCLPSSYTDESSNMLFYVDVLEGDEDLAIKDGVMAVVTYYYYDEDCTEGAGEPETATINFWDCEIDETGSYAMSFYVSGETAPKIQFEEGYAVTMYDSDTCYSDRQISLVAAAPGYCVTEYDENTKKIASYVVTCTATGAKMQTYANENCEGTPKSTVDPLAGCEVQDATDEYSPYYSVECGTFETPTAAPTRMAPLEIDGWVSTTYFKGQDCTADEQDFFTTASFGLCMEVWDESSQEFRYYVQNIVYDPADPTKATFPVRIFSDEDCSIEYTDAEFDKEAVAKLTQAIDNVGECVNAAQEDGSGSYKRTVSLGPVVPASGWAGGYMSVDYVSDTCSYSSIATLQVKPNHIVCSTTTSTEGVVSSYQLECTANGATVVYNWDDADCGVSTSSKPSYNYVMPKQECEYSESSSLTTYTSAVCTDTFPASPTGPPAPAPAPASIEGYIVQTLYEDYECKSVESVDFFSVGTCQKAFNPHVGQLKYKLEHASAVTDGTLTITTFFYEDKDCTYYRDEKDEEEYTRLGECIDGQDGHYYKQSWSEGTQQPGNPFSQGSAITSDFTAADCPAERISHTFFFPLNKCVNTTEAQDDDNYIPTIIGSTVYLCNEGDIEKRIYTTDSCKREYSVERQVKRQCQEFVTNDPSNPNFWQDITCDGGPAPEPVVGGYSYTIDFTATQIIDNCAYSQYDAAKAVYVKVLTKAIAESCSTSAVIIDTSYVKNLIVSSTSSMSEHAAAADAAVASRVRDLAAGALSITYRVTGLVRVPGTTTATVMKTLQTALADGAFTQNMQSAAIMACGSARGLVGATSTRAELSATPIPKKKGTTTQGASSGSADSGVSGGAAAGIAIAVIFAVGCLVAIYYYYNRGITRGGGGDRGRETSSSELYSSKNTLFGMGGGAFDPRGRRPTAAFGTFGDIHGDRSSASENYPTLSGSRSNPLRDAIPIPDPNQYSGSGGRRVSAIMGGRPTAGMASHNEDL